MNTAQFFGLSTQLVLCGWLLLMAALLLPVGRWRAGCLQLGGRVIPLLLFIGFALGLAWTFQQGMGGGVTSWTAVQEFYATPERLLVNWAQVIAYDLLLGRWLVDDGLAQGFHPLGLIALLVLALFLGPIGLLLYLPIRWFLLLKKHEKAMSR